VNSLPAGNFAAIVLRMAPLNERHPAQIAPLLQRIAGNGSVRIEWQGQGIWHAFAEKLFCSAGMF
jgi:hypothetical protein